MNNQDDINDEKDKPTPLEGEDLREEAGEPDLMDDNLDDEMPGEVLEDDYSDHNEGK